MSDVDTKDIPYLGSVDDVPYLGAERPPANDRKKRKNPENEFATKGWPKVLLESINIFRPPEDPSSKALLQSFKAPGDLVRSGVSEVLNRIASGGSEGSSDWRNAIRGEMEPTSAKLLKMFPNMNSKLAKTVGFLTDMYSDPMGGMMAGGIKGKPYGALTATKAANRVPLLKQVPSEAIPIPGKVPVVAEQFAPRMIEGAGMPPDRTLLDAVVQGSPVPQLAAPIANRIRRAGRAFYGAPFNRANQTAVRDLPHLSEGGKVPEPLIDVLWNEKPGQFAKPQIGGYGKTPQQIAQEYTALRKAKGKEVGMASQMSREIVDLAPGIQDKITGFMVDKLGMENAAKVKDVRGWFMGQIASDDPAASKQAIELLQQVAPNLAEPIKTAAKNLIISQEKEPTIRALGNLLENLWYGPRNLEQWQAVKTAGQNQAARNMEMGGNFFSRFRLNNNYKGSEAAIADSIGDVIQNSVESAYRGFSKTKKDYSALRNAEKTVWNTMTQKGSKDPLTALDLMMAFAALRPGAWSERMALAGKLAHKAQISPQFMTGTGMLLNDISKSSVWDNMLRRGILSNASEEK